MSKVVTKKDLAAKVAEECSMSKTAAEQIVTLVINEMAETLKEKGSVDLKGFGKFTVAERGARKGFNPLTKEPIEIPASYGVKFKASKTLKDAVK